MLVPPQRQAVHGPSRQTLLVTGDAGALDDVVTRAARAGWATWSVRHDGAAGWRLTVARHD